MELKKLIGAKRKKKLKEYHDQLSQSSQQIEEVKPLLQRVTGIVQEINEMITKKQASELKEKFQAFQQLSQEYYDLKENLMSYPTKISEQKDHITGLKEVVVQAQEEKELIESTLFMQINNAKDSNGRSQYSNKSARQAALKQLKQDDAEYQQAKQKLKEAESELEQAKLELNRLQNSYKSCRYVAEMAARRMNILS